jgi:putative transposase
MNPPKCDDLDDIHFLIAAQKVCTGTEAARCAPEGAHPPAHDAFTCLLQRQPPDTEALWRAAQAFVDRQRGLLVLDDTTLDKPYARQMELVTFHWSGKQRRVVQGIALMTLLWIQGQALVPCNCTTSRLGARARTSARCYKLPMGRASGRRM